MTLSSFYRLVVQPLQVSLRRQEIADRLNAWTIFNDKNKQFCDWLTQMENKVSHRGDLSIEEMVEKLKKVRETAGRVSNTRLGLGLGWGRG